MKGFYEWAEKFGYTRNELMDNYKLREILLDEYVITKFIYQSLQNMIFQKEQLIFP